MNQTVNIAVLGAGGMGTKHASNLARMRGVNIVAVCSKPRQDAVSLAGTLNIAEDRVYTDFEKMLDESCPDACVVALPPFAHSGQVEEAASRGVHLFVEKPIALDVAHGSRMVRAVEKTGVIAQVGYHMRFGKATRKLKQLIESGKAGLPTLFDARYACNSLHNPWWIDKHKSGGQVFEQAIHLYDMALHLLGEPSRVCGFMSNLCHRDTKGYTVEDTSAATLRFASGALGNICATNCAVPMEWNNPFTVVCENLTAHFRTGNDADFIFTAGSKLKRQQVTSDADMYMAEARAFIDAIRGKAANPAPITEALTGLKMVDAVRRSAAAGGQAVRL